MEGCTMRVGRNDPCPCGSGKKYKKCCLAKDRAAPESPLAPLPRTPEDERAEAHWEEFDARDFEGRVALFREALADPELMDDDAAYEMLMQLHTDAIEHGDRPCFAKLVAELREQRPDVY